MYCLSALQSKDEDFVVKWRGEILSWKNLSQLLHQPNIKCHTRGERSCCSGFNKRILQSSRARVDVSWMKEDIVVRLASVTSLANYCEAAVWIFRHGKIEIKKSNLFVFRRSLTSEQLESCSSLIFSLLHFHSCLCCVYNCNDQSCFQRRLSLSRENHYVTNARGQRETQVGDPVLAGFSDIFTASQFLLEFTFA